MHACVSIYMDVEDLGLYQESSMIAFPSYSLRQDPQSKQGLPNVAHLAGQLALESLLCVCLLR